MTEKEIKEKLEEYADILISLNENNVTRTYNSPVGDYAEWIVSKRLGLELKQNSNKGYDAVGEDNKYYQIKGCWLSPGKKSKRLSVIRNLEDEDFDFLLAVVFGERFDIEEAYKIPREIISEYFSYNKHQNGHVVNLNKRLLSDPKVVDIKHKLI